MSDLADRTLELVRITNQQRLQIDEICRAHRIIAELRARRAFGFGTLTGGAIMAAIVVAAYFLGGLQWLAK